MKYKLPEINTKKALKLIPFLIFSAVLFLFPSPNAYFQTLSKDLDRKESVNLDLPDPPMIPVNSSGVKAPEVTSNGIMIVDLPSNIVLFEKNSSQKFNPASTTKIITALVALDHFQLDDVLTVNRVETDGRTMGLVSGEKLTFESLLYAALVHSANDAAWTIAENYPGGAEKFVEAMNNKVGELNLKSSHFTNPIGFDDEKMYTTPEDLSKIAKAALNNKLVSKIVGTKNITVSDIDYTRFHALSNVNELLGKIAGVAGVKTGYTENGGEILVSEVKKNNHSVLFVILKSKDRFGETTILMDWVFNNFIWKKITDIIPTTQ